VTGKSRESENAKKQKKKLKFFALNLKIDNLRETIARLWDFNYFDESSAQKAKIHIKSRKNLIVQNLYYKTTTVFPRNYYQKIFKNLEKDIDQW